MDPASTTDMPQPSIDQFMNLGSIVAVTVLTLFVVSIIKSTLANVTFLKDVPVGVFIVLVAIGLTVFANKVLLTLPGDNLWLLIWRSAVSALASSGLYKVPEWASTLKKTAAIILLCLLPAGLMSGCVLQSEVDATREGINAGTAKIRQDHKEWAQAIAGVPGHHLPDLSQETAEFKATWLDSKLMIHSEYDKWLAASRARRPGPLGIFGWLFGAKPPNTQTAP